MAVQQGGFDLGNAFSALGVGSSASPPAGTGSTDAASFKTLMGSASEDAEEQIKFCTGWLDRLIMGAEKAQRKIEQYDLPRLRRLVEDLIAGKPGADKQADLWIPIVKRGINAALNEMKMQIQTFELSCYKYLSPEQKKSLDKVKEKVAELEKLYGNMQASLNEISGGVLKPDWQRNLQGALEQLNGLLGGFAAGLGALKRLFDSLNPAF